MSGKLVLINLRVTKEWRDFAHNEARKKNMNLSEYLRYLVTAVAAAETTIDAE
jgi:hypothetical protein